MVQVLEKESFGEFIVNESRDIREVKDALDVMLYVPDMRIKPKITQIFVIP